MGYSIVSLPYGNQHLSVQVPTDNLIGVFQPGREGESPLPDEMQLLHRALEEPIGSARLREMAQPEQQVVIVISDLTRPCPSARLLTPVLYELGRAGVPDENVTVVAALGLHRRMTEAELESAAGSQVYHRVKVINHDPTQTVRLGTTSAGTPVEFFRPVVEAGLRVCLGDLVFHYFAGYSGGAKAILPGCASQETVRANHAMMIRDKAAAGRISDNPVRQDIEEAVAMLGVDFILNVVLDGQHHIVGAVAGDVTLAHRAGCEMVRQLNSLPIPGRADVVVVSAGGFPKDINLYQAHKALENAAHAVSDQGIIILVAECREGFGHQVFEEWMRGGRNPDSLLERIRKEFVLGGHKAASIASIMKRAGIYFVSDMPHELVSSCGFIPFTHPDEAVQAALQARGQAATLIALPEGGSSLPQAA